MIHDQLRLTLIGGSTLLIEWRGLRLLTDPTFDDAGSVFEHGPVVLRKTARPAADMRTVEPIHAVLPSHDQHEDNLERERKGCGYVIRSADWSAPNRAASL